MQRHIKRGGIIYMNIYNIHDILCVCAFRSLSLTSPPTKTCWKIVTRKNRIKKKILVSLRLCKLLGIIFYAPLSEVPITHIRLPSAHSRN